MYYIMSWTFTITIVPNVTSGIICAEVNLVIFAISLGTTGESNVL